MAGVRVRDPSRCSSCHHWKRKKHHCSSEGPCKDYLTCPTSFKRGHPELQKEKGGDKREHAKKKKTENEQRKQEEKAKKRKIEELLKVAPPPDYDTYFKSRLEELRIEDPVKYDTAANGWVVATEKVVVEWAKLNQTIQAERKLKQRLKKLKTEKSLDERYDWIKRTIGNEDESIDERLVRLETLTTELDDIPANGNVEQPALVNDLQTETEEQRALDDISLY